MIWNVDLADELEAEWDELPGDVQDELLAHGKLLEQFGPHLGRPRVDTLKGSRYGNMKELRFDVTFAFDPRRRAVLLIAGDKSGTPQRRFYRQLIEKADARYAAHLAKLKVRK
ncbi:MAG TPA: type II toxin-antitoxin system RelE/ParE family toxin [Steroidobacteraceae bacterium]|jgi:hypothetical protein|nr:type II toxin-antitoxin system RelE/ParE family toxin [Steroidobacteraceae bacterium]